MSGTYDLVVVGGGVTGASLLYTTAAFTDVDSIALVEKEPEIAAVNSHRTSNSQTLHFGDIETNYSRAKAESVKEGAELLAGYLEHNDPDRELHAKRPKMVLGVGEDEAEALDARYHDDGFGDLFPKLRPIGREEIAAIEPSVVAGRDPDVELRALYTPDGYTVDYGRTAQSFVDRATAAAPDAVDIYTGTSVTDVERTADGYRMATSAGRFDCEAAVVAAGPYSLAFAKTLGYAEDKVLLPVAGSYFDAGDLLNGKVYTLQTKRLPFAAVHGDADVHDPSVTRFGPTAKPVPTLERGRLSTAGDLPDVFGFDAASVLSYATILSDRVLLPFLARNLLYDLPVVGPRQFLPHVQKVVPSVGLDDIERAEGYGGVRPQLVDTSERSLDMDEAKVVGDDILFNVTPSPGASNCLKNALRDTRTVVEEFLDGDYAFDEAAFRAATVEHFD